ELTPYGSQLEDVVARLGVWGAQSLGEARPNEIITADSMVLALRSTFVPAAARDLRASYELRLGPVTVHARVEEGAVRVAEGSLEDADLIIEAGPAIQDLMNGELSPAEALAEGTLRIVHGEVGLLDRFVQVFRIPAKPAADGGSPSRSSLIASRTPPPRDINRSPLPRR